MGKIRDILVKYSCTVTEKPTLKLPKPKNTMTSAVFASVHNYYTHEATKVSVPPLPNLKRVHTSLPPALGGGMLPVLACLLVRSVVS